MSVCVGGNAWAEFDTNEVQELLASNGEAGDYFGQSVAILGDLAVIGASEANEGCCDNEGMAYVFRFDAKSGQWLEETVLTASDGQGGDPVGDIFGWVVAAVNDTAFIGAVSDDDNGEDAGAVYVFRRQGDFWLETQKLLASDGAAQDAFGSRMAAHGDVLLLGAPGDDDGGENAGSAYVFRFDGASWVEEAELIPSDSLAGSGFGNDVALWGDVAVIGSSSDDDLGLNSGSAYVFRYDGQSWQEEQKLLPDDGEFGDRFGIGLALSENAVVIGAFQDDDNGSGSGSAYVFRHDGDQWVQEQKLLADDGDGNDWFGVSVALAADTAVIGAGLDETNGSSSGSAYLFRFDGHQWLQTAKLLASDGAAGDEFGQFNGVAIDGETVMVGARRHDDNGIWSGATYVYDATAGVSPADLASCSLTFGSTDNPPCDVANLTDDDDVDQILRSQFGFSAFERNLTEIVIIGNGADATSMVSINTRDGSDTTNVVAKVKARNYTTNSIDDIVQYEVSFPSDDTAHSTPVNSTDYVDANGDVEIRLRFVAPATFTPMGFTVGLDLVEVLVD